MRARYRRPPLLARATDAKDHNHEANSRLTRARTFSRTQWTVEEEDALRDGVRKYVYCFHRPSRGSCAMYRVESRENSRGAFGLRARILPFVRLTRERVLFLRDTGMDRVSGD